MTEGELWVGTSWKMTKTRAEAQRYVERLVAGLGPVPGLRPFVIPPFTALATVAAALGPASPVLLGAQNCHWASSGAWTGEVSVPMLADLGVGVVEIGHSERREHFGETDHTVELKVRAALAGGLMPLVCVGESAEVRRHGDPVEHVAAQVRAALGGPVQDGADLGRVLVAYEPIWAIGEHGREPHRDEVAPVVAGIHDALADLPGPTLPAGVLYGGSVNTANAAGLLGIPGCGGLFAGRAAWQADGYLGLLRIAAAHGAASVPAG